MTEHPYISILNNEFFEKVIQNQFKWKQQDFTIESVQTTNAGGNKNYQGVLLRSKTCVKQHDNNNTITQSYITKFINNDAPLNVLADSDKESFMYETIIPALEEIFSQGSDEISFAPECYGILKKSQPCIVLQDLCPDNYKVVNEPLNLCHALLVIEKIAKFHAASVIYCCEKNNSLPDSFEYGMYCDKIIDHPTDKSAHLVKGTLCEEMSKWPGFEEEYEIMSKWNGAKSVATICKAIKKDPKGFSVLCHGDLWSANMLFLHNADEEPIDVKFIDFQGSFHGTPIWDLLFFITMSLESNVRVEHFDTLINHYIKQLTNSLIKLKYKGDIPTSEEIYAEITQRSIFAVILLYNSFLVVTQDEEELLSFDKLIDDTEVGEKYRKSVITKPEYVDAVSTYLKFLSKRGALNCEHL